MSVHKDKERGTWYVSYRVTDPVTGSALQKKKRGFKTKREAVRWETELEEEKAKHTSISFREALKLYLSDSEASDTTRELKEHWIQNHFPYVDTPVEKITKDDLVTWRLELKDSGLATRTMNRGIQYVKSVFSFISLVYDIPNPSVVLKTFKLTKEDKEEMEVWTPEEFDQFIEYVSLPVYKAYFTFLFWTGCRRSEALAVCKEDIKDGYVHIHRSIKHYKNGFLPLKNDSSERTIKIDSTTLEIMQPYISAADPFVFGTTQSLPISGVQRQFTKAIKESGVKKIRIHDLRHSHATFLINAGVNIVAVSKRLGHASINQTLKTYTHLLEKTNDEMMDTIEKHRNKS
ncbi:MAG: site-specific integrase [Solobacterium sp.]|nr:site-specific integrase [Solobacterium sp.]